MPGIPVTNAFTAIYDGTTTVAADEMREQLRVIGTGAATVSVSSPAGVPTLTVDVPETPAQVPPNSYFVGDGGYASLEAAVAVLGSTPATVSFSEDQTLTGNLAIPATMELDPRNGAIINAGSYTLTGLKTATPDLFARNTVPGTTDMTAAVGKAALASAKVTGGGTYLCDSLVLSQPVEFTGGITLKTSGTVATFIRITSANVKFDGVTVDINGKDVSRGIRVEDNAAGFKFRNSVLKNISSSTFAYGIAISDIGVTDFAIEDSAIDNITAAANSTVGDQNGSSRAIYFGGSSSGSNPTTPSYGVARNLDITNVETAEDGDGIQYYSTFTNLFFEMSDIRFRNCAKRAIKVQAANSVVRNITVDALSLPARMAALVSVYGNNCVLENVSGSGLIKMGVDVISSNVTINGLTVNNTGTADVVSFFNAALLITAGDNISASKIKGTNLEHGVSISPTGNISNVMVDGVVVSTTKESLSVVKTASTYTIDRVTIRNVTATTTGLFSSLYTNQVTTFDILTNFIVENADFTNQNTSYAIDVWQAGKVTLRNMKMNGIAAVASRLNNITDLTVENFNNAGISGTSLYLGSVNRGKVSGVKSTSAMFEVDINAGDDIVVDGVYYRPLGTAVRNTGATNVQTGSTFKYVTPARGTINVISNGGFDSDTVWTKYNGATISGGVAVLADAGFQSVGQPAGIINGATYDITYRVVSITGGSVRCRAGLNGVGTDRTAVGTYTETLVANTTGGAAFYFEGTNGFSITIDDIEVYLWN